MRKKLPFVFLFAILFSSHAQTITQTFNEPKAGDLEFFFPLDTSGYKSGLPTAATGSNVTWDFTKLDIKHPIDTNVYLSPSSVPAATGFPGCTFVQSAAGMNTFLKSAATPTTQTEVLGLQMTPFMLTFTNTAVIMKYPGTFSLSFTDNISGTATGPITATVTGNVTTKIDAMGTINLPMNVTYSNVIRVKSVQTLTLTNTFPVGTFKQTYYNFYHSSQKFPILSITYMSVAMALSQPTVTGFAYGSTNFFIDGITPNELDQKLSIYPQPNSGSVGITFKSGNIAATELAVYSLTGQLVEHSKLEESDHVSTTLKLNGPAGVYLLVVKHGTLSAFRKLVKE
jgi:hypothetical protein